MPTAMNISHFRVSLVAVILVTLLTLAVACEEEEDGDENGAPTEVAEETAAEEPGAEIPAYSVVGTEDVSFGDTVRLTVRAVTDFPVTKEQAQAVMDEIIEDVSGETPLNALSVFLYDYEELADGTFTLAMAEFAPDGEWDKADEVEAGDYERHETVYEFKPKMDDPDAALPDRPSSEEAVLCAAFNKASAENPDIVDDRDQAIGAIAAEEVQVTAQEIVDAARKCASWTFR